jgi:hypothetical protein
MEFLLHLNAIGREAAHGRLAGHFDHIGHRSPIDIGEKFL